VGGDRARQKLAVAEEVLLADHVGQGGRAHALGEGDGGLELGVVARGRLEEGRPTGAQRGPARHAHSARTTSAARRTSDGSRPTQRTVPFLSTTKVSGTWATR